MDRPESSSRSKAYEFGPFVLNTALRELQRAGEPVDIQRRVLDLLVFLIENRDRTVSKDELQDAVWPGTIVTEAALSRAVMKARRALADDGQEQRFIRTVHGQGYRFVGEVGLRDADAAGRSEAVAHDRRQAVWRVATAYAAAAWLINQAAAMVWEAFEWSRLPQQVLLAVSVLGFPLVLAFTWFYRLTPGGMALRSEPGTGGLIAHRAFPERLVIATLALALVLSVGWNLRDQLDASAPAERVVVLPMRNATGSGDYGWLSFGMLSLLQTQLADAGIPVASAADVIRQFSQPLAEVAPELLTQLARTQGARWVVNASVAAVGDQFRTDGVLFDAGREVALPSFTGGTPTEAVRALGRHLAEQLRPSRADPRYRIDSGDPFVDQAYARGMHEQLSGNLGRARDLLQIAADAAPETFWPGYELAVAMRRLGDLEGARSDDLAMLERAKRSNEPLQVAVLSNELGIIEDLAGNLAQSEAHYREGLDWAERGGLHERRAVLLVNYAILERARANPVHARELLGGAITAYADAGIELLPGDFYITLGNTAADAGDFDGALAHYRQGLENFRAMNRPRGEGIALSNLSWASEQLGDLAAARQYLDDSLALRERIGDDVGVLKSKIRKADLLYTLGRFDEVLAVIDEVMAAQYARAEPELLSTAFRFRGTVAADRGDFPLSRTWFEQALALDAGDGRERGACEARLGLIRAYVAEHDFDAAERELGTLLDVAESRSLAHIRLEGLQQRAGLLREQGRDDEVIELLRRAVDEARAQANERMLARLATDLADVYFEAGDARAVASWVGVAVEAQPAQGYVRLAEAQLALLRRERARAERLLDEAAALLGERLSGKQQALRARLTSV